ncbi:MAG: hypothetical protein IKL09_02570 [Clostridia bacterium]|nr:hypothetical protein [Clostridia bacterium]
MGFSYASLLPVIIICLIFVALIIYKVYSNIYRKKINKKLEANESMAHVSMLPSESIGKVLVIIGLSIFTFSTISMLSDISSELHNNQNNINNTITVNACVPRNTYKTEEQIWQSVLSVMPSSD